MKGFPSGIGDMQARMASRDGLNMAREETNSAPWRVD